jgi:hypothetical protein
MPQIIVAADRGAAFGDGAVTFREGVNVADFESPHFAAQLVERLGWAVEDADELEQIHAEPDERHHDPEEIRTDPPEIGDDSADDSEWARHDSFTAPSPV